MSKYLIIGGHGKVALLASKLLAEQGHRVTAVIRNPEHTADVEATGAHALVLDVEEASTEEMAHAFAGQDAIIWSAGAGGGNPARTRAVDHDAAIRSMDAAAAAGVTRYVMVSYLGSRADHGVDPENGFWHYAEAKAAADDYLRSTDLDWTILGPGRLTLDQPTGRIAVGQAANDARGTSRANVAAAVVAVLGDPLTVRHTIRFTDGTEAIPEAVREGEQDG
ncbi:MAG TPA: SDR family oxidoreductase [Actinomycetales bacterium]|nr:SDR family oxidoreductase [Actinomycetales bacterium]